MDTWLYICLYFVCKISICLLSIYTHSNCGFLALLDYISRAHKIVICPSFVCRPSVRVAIISESNARISFKFWLLLLLGHMLRQFFFIFWNIFFYFSRIFFMFANMVPYGSENFNTLLLLQIAAESFQTFPEFSSQWSSQNYVWDVLNVENWILTNFICFR